MIKIKVFDGTNEQEVKDIMRKIQMIENVFESLIINGMECFWYPVEEK